MNTGAVGGNAVRAALSSEDSYAPRERYIERRGYYDRGGYHDEGPSVGIGVGPGGVGVGFGPARVKCLRFIAAKSSSILPLANREVSEEVR